MVPSRCLPGSSWLGQRCLCWVGGGAIELANHSVLERLTSFRWFLFARAAPHVAGVSLASPLPNHEEGSQLLKFAMQSLPSTHCILIQNEMGLIDSWPQIFPIPSPRRRRRIRKTPVKLGSCKFKTKICSLLQEEMRTSLARLFAIKK